LACRRLINQLIDASVESPEQKLLVKTQTKLTQYDKKIAGYLLGQNQPNPFNPGTWTYFPFSIPNRSDVTLKVYNRIGSLVRTSVRKNLMPGRYYSPKPGSDEALRWDCKDDAGQTVESGTYFAQMSAGLFQQTNKIDVSQLRLLDGETHPLFSSYYQFKSVPKCVVRESSIRAGDYEKQRPFGTTAFGWSIGDRTPLVYTEWAGILWYYNNPDSNISMTVIQRAREFFINVLVFAMQQPGSLAQRI
jgi:hypothetical protein